MINLVEQEVVRLSQDEGLNDSEIAQELGCCRATINRIRKKKDIPRANLANRKDKSYICGRCGKEVFIRRKEYKKIYCPECKES